MTGVLFDEAAKALELFGTANVAVAHAAATDALQLTEGKTKAGIVWPEELDADSLHRVGEHPWPNVEYECQGW